MQFESGAGLLVGTGQHDALDGSNTADLVIGLSGNDTITTGGDADLVHGDFVAENLLQSTEDAISFDQYGASGQWTLSEDADGNPQMSQTVTTLAGAQYEISFEVAANYAAGKVSGRVEVLWNGEAIGTVDTSSGAFSDATLNFAGTGSPGELTFRALPGEVGDGPSINTDGPVYWYEKAFEVGGETVTVKAFAEGQANIYQVMDGQLNVFDPGTETYTPAGAEATVVVNAIGFNQQDDLIYGIAVKDGKDSLGNDVAKTDLVMFDAEGNAYRVGETPYRSWTGDFDSSGNLWAFEADLDRITMIDVDQKDANGNPIATTFKFPSDLETDKVWDVAYDTSSGSFYGLVRPSDEGATSRLIRIDISDVANGGEPTISDITVTGTLVDGVLKPGLPEITFGAFVIDGDGNFYAGGNGGDHDMDDATGTSGGIYRIAFAEDGTARLELVSDAPKAYSNDGAVDPRAMDPFSEFDPFAEVLIRGPELHEVEDQSNSYDDSIETGAGQDSVFGGYGNDIVVGSSLGDMLNGGVGDDYLHGGAGPNSTSQIVSYYDDDGLRYDQFGNLLPEDDDILVGGHGADEIVGSAGHDALYGEAGNDVLSGGSGNDVLHGGSGNDQMSGGGQSDVLSGGTGQDDLQGGSGDDTMDGGEGMDTLSGGSGNDALSGGDGDDELLGGSGDDFIFGDMGSDTLDGGSGHDVLNGGGGNDRVLGGSGNDQLNGDDGRDVLVGGTGDDVLNGGSGRDKLNGGSGNDQLFGGADHDYLNGYHGNDTLNGEDGNDVIVLGRGSDLAYGGDGNDRFVIKDGDQDGSVNWIGDFTRNASEADRFDLRDLAIEAKHGDVDAWVSENLVTTLSGSVVLTLDNDTTYHFSTQDGVDAETLRQEIVDGLMF